jgi:hypothetical protein
VLCLDAWVLIQDLGFLGGLGTDPNSMIPFVLLAVSGYLALTRSAACSGELVARQATAATPAPATPAPVAAASAAPARGAR